MKLHVISRALHLRARRPEAFAGAYTLVQAGPDVIAFTRGDGDVLVVVELRLAPGAPLDSPPGRWRDALDGREHDLQGATPASRLVGDHGLALLERM